MRFTKEEKEILVKVLAERMKNIVYANAEKKIREYFEKSNYYEWTKPNDTLVINYEMKFLMKDLRQLVMRKRRKDAIRNKESRQQVDNLQ